MTSNTKIITDVYHFDFGVCEQRLKIISFNCFKVAFVLTAVGSNMVRLARNPSSCKIPTNLWALQNEKKNEGYLV